MFNATIIGAVLCCLVPTLFAQDGHTVFALPVGYAAGVPIDVAAGDLDGDDDLDLAVGQVLFAGPLRIFKNDGNGAFTPAGSVPGLVSVAEVELGDLNGDGAADLVVRQFSDIGVLLNNGSGSFGSQTVLLTGSNAFEVTLADIDGDLDIDIVAGIHGATTIPPQGVQLLLNDGSGSFSAGQLIAEPSDGANWTSAADINNDGLIDLVYATFSPVRLHAALATAPGVFGAPYEIHDETISFLSFDENWGLADVTGDDHPDVLWTNPFIGELNVIVNAGDGTFGEPVVSPLPSPTGAPASVVIAELNGHGVPEVLISFDSTPWAIVLSGPGDGSFEADVIIDGLTWVEEPLLSDFDGDGDDDLVLVETSVDQLFVLFNHTYPQDSPFTDLGFALPNATSGHPVVLASGAPAAGQTLAFELFNAAPSAAAALFVGISAIHAPFKGGVLVPNPDAVFIPLTTSPAGELPLSATWPLGPGGYSFWAQYWILDAGGPAGFTASTAVRTDVP